MRYVLVSQALGAIAIAYAKAYNREAAKQGLLEDCINNNLDFELYIDPTTTKIDPFTAFYRVHNINKKLTIYKHSSGLGKVWGTGSSSHQLNIWSAGYFDTNNISYLSGYGKYSLYDAMNNYKRFITHEMGHIFENTVIDRLGEYPRSLVTGNLASGSRSEKNGFCDTQIEYSDNRAGWQWRMDNGSWEYFADMYIGWTYDCWEHVNNDFTLPLTSMGQARADFMDEHMQEWIYSLINSRSGVEARKE